jgi:16S rRNA (guanine1207-N2)-methyltransferase
MRVDIASDTALETLLVPISEGRIQWPADGVLFLRARDGAALHQRPLPGLTCEQSFKPDADALRSGGFALSADVSRAYSLVMLLPPRQRDEARALMARAIATTKPGGRVMASVSNDEGARSSEADLEKLAGPVNTITKNKCRVFWTEPLHGPADTALAAEWLALDAVRPISERFVSRPGVFAWNRIDPASALLAKHLPADLGGDAADLGAGFGYLSAELLARCPQIVRLDLYEAEQRALDLAKQNLTHYQSRAELHFHWHDVTVGLPHRYDVIVTNPPFHTQSSADRPDIGRRFITSAADALNPGGQLWLVANRHLPYETVLTHSFGTVRTVCQEDGFKIVAATKSSANKSSAKPHRQREASPRTRR